MANEDQGQSVGGVTADHPAAALLPVLVSPSTADKGKNTIRMELIPVGCWKLDDVRFAFGSTFLLPSTKREFSELSALLKKHPKAPLSVFGHADPVGDEAFNKALSGRRAESVYAVLIRDTDRWEQLYQDGGSSEGWSTRSIQEMLTALGHDPGPIDGVSGPKTKAGVESFQRAAGGLTVDGAAGPLTRAKLFAAYMDFLSADKLSKADFFGQGKDAGGKGDYQGCGEFNPAMVFSQAESQSQSTEERNRENSTNRRVLILLFRPGTPPSDKWPCPRASEGAGGCQKRLWSDANVRRNPQAARRKFADTLDTFGCRFYHRLTVASPCEGVMPPPPAVTVEWIEFNLAEYPMQAPKKYWPKHDAKIFPTEKYESKLTSGPKSGALDNQAKLRVDPLPGGQCEIRFPDFYKTLEQKLGPATPWPVPVAPKPPVPGPVVPPVIPPGPSTPNKKLTLVSVDPRFAPGVETLTVRFDIKDLAGESVKFVVVSDAAPATIIFERELDAAEKADGDGKSFEWDGVRADGKRLGPVRSPYSVSLQLADGSRKDTKPAKVEVDKIELTVDAPGNKLQMNDPVAKKLVKAKVFIKKKDGTGVVTPLGLNVKFTFTAGAGNTTAANSFVYAAPKTLGKNGDAAALYWEAHPDSTASSGDGFKASVLAMTGNSGTKEGVAAIHFLPSGVGGNTYKIKATLAGVTKESQELTVWRKLVFEPYQMPGQTHVSTHGTTAHMANYYKASTFVQYELGTVHPVGAKFTVNYIGLWDHATQAQLNWANHQKKTAAESPTAQETADANGPAGAARTAARAAIQAKADAWFTRIDDARMDALQNWATDAALPVNAIVAIEDEHPKYSAQSPAAHATTAEWASFPWLRITVDGSATKPDNRWSEVQGFSFQSRAYIYAGLSAARAKVVVAHEAGHESKNQFKRSNFGGGDHSPAAGLMDETGSLSAFTAAEIKILRGIL